MLLTRYISVHSSSIGMSNPFLSNGIVLLVAREAQHLLHCSCAEFLQLLVEPPSTCLSYTAVAVPGQPFPVMSHTYQLNVCGDVQVVTEPLWDAAATAYFHLGDIMLSQALKHMPFSAARSCTSFWTEAIVSLSSRSAVSPSCCKMASMSL